MQCVVSPTQDPPVDSTTLDIPLEVVDAKEGMGDEGIVDLDALDVPISTSVHVSDDSFVEPDGDDLRLSISSFETRVSASATLILYFNSSPGCLHCSRPVWVVYHL